MSKMILTIELDNDAFQPDPCFEVARILRNTADEIEASGYIAGRLRDINGNPVGTVDLKGGK